MPFAQNIAQLRGALLGLIFLVGLCFLTASVRAQDVSTATVLDGKYPTLAIGGQVQAWIESGTHTSIEQLEAKAAFGKHGANQAYPLALDKTVWIKLRVRRAPGDTGDWVLEIPIPYLDDVSLYQRDATQRWTEQRSGDTVAHSEWAKQGLSPAFHLILSGQDENELFLRVRSRRATVIPIRLLLEPTFDLLRVAEFMTIGAILGVLLMLSTLSLVRYGQHRYHYDLGAAVYGLLVMLTVAQMNGVLNASVWYSFPLLADMATRLLAVTAIGGTLLYMRGLYSLSVHYHRFDKLLGATGAGAILVAVAIVTLDQGITQKLESAFFVVAVAVALAASVLSWRARSSIWLWMAVATVPQSLCVLWIAAEIAGLLEPMWQLRYITTGCVALAVPVLAFALGHISRERKERVQRILHLDKQDALTGLHKREVFDQHLANALQRVRHDHEQVAMVVVSIVNHADIVEHYGSAIGEQCELRAVVKLHRVLRDIDPASRLVTGKFALLLEGVKDRDQLGERMVKLIASGLTPQPGLQPEVPLVFHAACVLLQEQPLAVETGVDELLALLETMAPGTRRPIRYLDATETLPVQDAPRSGGL